MQELKFPQLHSKVLFSMQLDIPSDIRCPLLQCGSELIRVAPIGHVPCTSGGVLGDRLGAFIFLFSVFFVTYSTI